MSISFPPSTLSQQLSDSLKPQAVLDKLNQEVTQYVDETNKVSDRLNRFLQTNDRGNSPFLCVAIAPRITQKANQLREKINTEKHLERTLSEAQSNPETLSSKAWKLVSLLTPENYSVVSTNFDNLTARIDAAYVKYNNLHQQTRCTLEKTHGSIGFKEKLVFALHPDLVEEEPDTSDRVCFTKKTPELPPQMATAPPLEPGTPTTEIVFSSVKRDALTEYQFPR